MLTGCNILNFDRDETCGLSDRYGIYGVGGRQGR